MFIQSPHPITHETTGLPDYRYRIGLEWSGHATQQHVIRFCDEWVGSSSDYFEAVEIAAEHDAQRIAA